MTDATKSQPERPINRVLVTGGAGFIGANFIRWLLAERPHVRVVNLDALTYAGSRENLRDLPVAGEPTRHVFVHGDICDRALVESLLAEHDIDTIVHFAAESHVDRSITGPAKFVETNVTGTFSLLEAARTVWPRDAANGDGAGDTGARRFHHVSTDEVFGSLAPDDPAADELARYRPSSPYAASKAASDHLVHAYGITYGLPYTVTNCTNNYGPYQFPEKLIPLMIRNATTGRALPIYGDGRQVRDWLYVLDHCEGIAAVLERGRAGETYNIGGGNQPTNLEIVETICSILDRLFPDAPPHARLIRHVADRPGHDRRYALATDKIERELGWRPRHALAAGLEQTVAWYLGNADWLAAICDDAAFTRWIADNYAGRGDAANNAGADANADNDDHHGDDRGDPGARA